MTEEQNPAIETNTRQLTYTIPLTEAAESDDISPNEYVRRRASVVGEGNIFEYIIIPIVIATWRRLFGPRRKGGLNKPSEASERR